VEEGIRSVVLVPRHGAESPAAARVLRQELCARGALVEVVACDVGDRRQLRALLARVPASAPLTAVVHVERALDEGDLLTLDEKRLAEVVGSTVDAAVSLDELTRDLDLRAFALFSSVPAAWGGAGQVSGAVAGAVLDAVAVRRHRAGLPAVSIAWGPWACTGAARRLAPRHPGRAAGAGLGLLDDDRGMALMSALWTAARPTIVAAALELPTLHEQARSGSWLPAVLRDLVGPVRRSARSPR
jgi:mycoketide-CoA synthase